MRDYKPHGSTQKAKYPRLDYTAQAFPGARAPDGPAPDLEEKLRKLGLIRSEAGQDLDAITDASKGGSR